MVRRDVKSYRQPPLHLYQIQTKFRDEIRPASGSCGAREFLMKDGYSFHTSFADLEREYKNMYATYSRIFERLGLKFRAVAADTGSIGGTRLPTNSTSWPTPARTPSPTAPDSDYAANVELAEAVAPAAPAQPPAPFLAKVATPANRLRRCGDLSRHRRRQDGRWPSPSSAKGGRRPDLRPASPARRSRTERNQGVQACRPGALRFASEGEVEEYLGCKPGYIGPVGIDPARVRVVADRTVAAMSDFVCGANAAGST